jgi:uncharacterized membrane protein
VAGTSHWVSGSTVGQEPAGWLRKNVPIGKLIPWQLPRGVQKMRCSRRDACPTFRYDPAAPVCYTGPARFPPARRRGRFGIIQRQPDMKPTQERWISRTGWIIPLGYAVATLVMGMVLPRLEHYFLPRLVTTISASAAEGICSSVASGMIALTGIVFSLTFVMVQFSATAYSPRLVLWVARDPVMAHALGMFTSTFLYALYLLAWVDRNASGKVPFITFWILVGLLIASMGMFIALIERVGRLQVSRMLIFTGDQGRKAIDELYRVVESAAVLERPSDHRSLPVIQTLTYVGRPQVIQAVHFRALLEMARASNTVIEVVAAVGDSLVEMTPLLRAHGAGQPMDKAALESTIQFGDERTFEQDPKYAIRLVVDIAIKALSPAINDPTTAVQALDQIEDLLLRLGQRRLHAGAFCDAEGKLRLIVPFPTWEDLLRLSLDEIRHYGADSVQVMRRTTALIKNLKAALPAKRHAALQYWEERLHGSIARTFADAEEQRHASVADRQGLGTAEEGTEHPGTPA